MGPQGLPGKKIAWPQWHFSRGHLFFLLGIFIPIVINLLALHAFVEPLKKKVADLGSLAALVELKPRMEALIAESNELMAQRVVKSLLSNDAGVALTEIRELAKIHKLEVKELHIKNAETTQGSPRDKALEAAGFKKIELSLDITGHYSKIARWLASLDQKMAIRVDDFTLTPSSTGVCELLLELHILLRNS
jgi:hypothetical protein